MEPAQERFQKVELSGSAVCPGGKTVDDVEFEPADLSNSDRESSSSIIAQKRRQDLSRNMGLFSTRLVSVVGLSTGHEGKGGTILDTANLLQALKGLPDAVGMVFRANGGANAGHTVAGMTLNLLPAGVADDNVQWIGLGRGVVADPRKLWQEIDPLRGRGVDVLSRLVIDRRAMVSDLTHRIVDLAAEPEADGRPLWGAGRGIAPAFMDEAAHRQIFFSAFCGRKCDFAEQMKERAQLVCNTIENICQLCPRDWFGLFDRLGQIERHAASALIKSGEVDPRSLDYRRFLVRHPYAFNLERLIDEYWEAGTALKRNLGDLGQVVSDLLAEGRHVIAEFGQGYWLDKRHGFPPDVTASHTSTPELFESANIPVQPVHIIGVCKAYDTRFRQPVFITRMEPGEPMRELIPGREVATPAGREFEPGWFDACEKGHAIRRGGADEIVINRLDALTHPDGRAGMLKVCTAYRNLSGELEYAVPDDGRWRMHCQPEYREFSGWSEDISQVRSFEDLPLNARIYVAGMYRAMIGAAWHSEPFPDVLPRLRFVGVGPRPGQVISDVPDPEVLMKLGA